jgi:hypothetical protein
MPPGPAVAEPQDRIDLLLGWSQASGCNTSGVEVRKPEAAERPSRGG